MLRVTLFAMLYLFADASLVLGAAVLWVRWPVPARRDQQRWNRTHARLLRWALSLLLADPRLLDQRTQSPGQPAAPGPGTADRPR